MVSDPMVAVSYQAEEERAVVATEVAGVGRVAFLTELGPADRLDALHEAEVLFGWNPQRELGDDFRAASRLRFIQLLSAGADQVRFGAVPDDVVLASNVGAFAAPMAEHVLAMVLALAKRLPQHHAEMAIGRFEQDEPTLTLDGAVCAVLGFGGIGRATARLMRGLGARIHAVNSSGHTGEPVEFCGTLADLDRVLAAADVLVIALPLNLATRSLIGARELRLMRPEAILVNVARGAIVDERALYEHLRDNPAFCAGIDAWWHEPWGGGEFRAGLPFFGLPNLVGSPHNSGVVHGILPVAARQAAENIGRYLRGEPLRGLVRREDYVVSG